MRKGARQEEVPKILVYARETYSNGINIYTAYIFDNNHSSLLKNLAKELFNRGRNSKLEVKTLDDNGKRIVIGDEIIDYIRPLNEKELREIVKEISRLQKHI